MAVAPWWLAATAARPTCFTPRQNVREFLVLRNGYSLGAWRKLSRHLYSCNVIINCNGFESYLLQTANVSLSEVGRRRDLSRRVVAGRCRLSLVVTFVFSGDMCRVLSRHV